MSHEGHSEHFCQNNRQQEYLPNLTAGLQFLTSLQVNLYRTSKPL